mgnify:CR=1 FL=1
MKKDIWILSNISLKMYGDSTRPFFLGRNLNQTFKITQYCNVNKREDKIEYINLFKETSFSKPFTILKASSEISKELKKKGLPKIIYAHQLLYGLIGILVKRKYPKVILVSDFHTSSYFEIKEEPKKGIKQKIKLLIIPFLENLVVKYSDKIITVSKETEQLLINDYPKSKGKINIVKNATDHQSVFKINVGKPNENKNEKSEKLPHLAIFPNPRDGFISNDLALDFLLEIANECLIKKANIKFIVLGGGKIPEDYPKNIIFTGYVENYNEWLNKADVCIATYPKKAVCGGVRNKICDYLAVGKPIVATSESMRGFDDLINGIHYYESNTINDFVNALNSVVEGNNKLMCKENLKKSKEYNWCERANELSVVFKSIINV